MQTRLLSVQRAPRGACVRPSSSRTPCASNRTALLGSLRKHAHGSVGRKLQAAEVITAHTAAADALPYQQGKDSAEMQRLRAENAALRAALAKAQGVAPEAVTFDFVWEQNGPVPVMLPGETDADDLDELYEGIRWPSPTENPPFWERPTRSQPFAVGGMTHAMPPRDQRSLHIVHITAEMAPLAKVGGLGDVVTGLSRASLVRGHNVEIMLPFYECIPESEVAELTLDREFDCPKGYSWDGDMVFGSLKTLVYRGKIDGCPVLLVRPDWSVCNIFKGGRIYGGSYNEIEAYLYFNRACLEYLYVTGRQPHVIHCHEWQTSSVPMLYWDYYNVAGLTKPRVMLTIHNLDNQGECKQDEFCATGVPGEAFATIERALDERTIGHNPERLCLMKGGVIYSNAVTTVSPTYAHEAVHGGAAGWLRATLGKPDILTKFHGVLNGIDTVAWDPSTDPVLPATYSPNRMEGKALCKKYLQEGLGMDVDPNKPLVACITRLVPQKGIHLIKHSILRTAEQGGQYVLLGSGHADGGFKSLAANEFKDSQDVKLLVMYSEKLAHLIYAAADMVVVPSMFEPCGLTQLIAMRYGAVPVVRATGGLADTVKDVDAEEGQGNGFSFDGIDEGSLNSALDRALRYYKENPEWWEELSRHNMTVDCSWMQSAQQYINLYNSMALW